MRITNKSGGPRGFFAEGNPVQPIIIMDGDSADIPGFNPNLPSHAAQIAAGEIALGESEGKASKAKADADARTAAEAKARG